MSAEVGVPLGHGIVPPTGPGRPRRFQPAAGVTLGGRPLEWGVDPQAHPPSSIL